MTAFLAQNLTSLQSIPITIGGNGAVFVDLRLGNSSDLLRGTPWDKAPQEADEQACMRFVTRSGDIAFDIGANVGIHSALLSALVGQQGRLYSFEPNPALLLNLERTLEGLRNASLTPVALSDESMSGTLFVPVDHTMGSIADWTKGRVADTAQPVPCRICTLDGLKQSGRIPQPDFIKCDVEGAELMVFKGGAGILNRRDGPVVLFEEDVNTSRGHGLGVAEARQFLCSLQHPNYQLFLVERDGILVPSSAPVRDHANVLAVPAARLALVQGHIRS